MFNTHMTMTASQDRQAFDMRSNGESFAAIAAALNTTTQNAWHATRRHAARYGVEVPNSRRSTGRTTARRSRPAGRQFGVEIECVGINRQQAEAALNAAGITARAESYNHTTRRHWKITTDASVSGGVEVVSPPLSGDAGKAELRTAMKALRDAGARIDGQCGMHVHHEVIDLTGEELATLVEFFAAKQLTMDALVAPSRRATAAQWASHLRPAEVRNYANIFRSNTPERVRSQRCGIGGRPSERYRTLNVHSYPTYGTFEFRQHQGSLNGTKAVAWVEFGQSIIEAAKAASEITTEGAEFLNDLAANGLLSTESATYLTERIDALN